MLKKLLGLMDVIAVLILIFSSTISTKMAMFAALYLVIKGIGFGLAGDWVSWIDAFCGFYIFFLIMGSSNYIITILVVVFLLQKAALSFF